MIDEDFLKFSKETFVETIELKLQQLNRFVEHNVNPKLLGDYIEELVRNFVRKWLGHRLLLHGTFYSLEIDKLYNKELLQIDGIVYDPTAGPPILHEGNFIIVHPGFCTNVIEIKKSEKSINQFRERLEKIYKHCEGFLDRPQIMGIVIHDTEPEKHSEYYDEDSELRLRYDFHDYCNCPIFILFKKTNNNFEPFYEAIDSMLHAIFSKSNRPFQTFH